MVPLWQVCCRCVLCSNWSWALLAAAPAPTATVAGGSGRKQQPPRCNAWELRSAEGMAMAIAVGHFTGDWSINTNLTQRKWKLTKKNRVWHMKHCIIKMLLSTTKHGGYNRCNYDQTRNVPSIPFWVWETQSARMKIKHSPILSGWSCLEATQPQERKAVQLYVSLASKHLEESGSLRGGWGDEADHRRLRLGSSEIDGRQYKSFIRKKTHHCFITSCSIEIVSYCTSGIGLTGKNSIKHTISQMPLRLIH